MTSNSIFDQHRWVIQNRRTLEEEPEADDTKFLVSIFNVPKTLLATDPDSYIPQEVALGPYHCLRPQFYEMEKYKLGAAKRIQKQLQTFKFEHLVDQLTKLEPGIRACYHKYLDFNGETLAWMMALDASFMLEFLQVYAVKNDSALVRNTTRMSHLVDYAGRKSAHNTILRDLVMLENQIPLFLLRKMLEFQFSSLQMADELLRSMLIEVCKELSPFKKLEGLQKFHVTECAHVLDVLYHMIVPKLEHPVVVVIEDEDQNEVIKESEENCSEKSNNVYKPLLGKIWNFVLNNSDTGPVGFLKRTMLSNPIKVVLKLPWSIIFNLLFSENKQMNPENENSNSSNNINRPPLIEEISIPSVTKLSKAGVRFSPTNGGIHKIFFDHKTCTLYLPTISLDVNTSVVLRNLVAYEACNASGPLVVTRYTELMNGIIDTKEDAKVLRERGIILSHLKSDEEVAGLWNGMSKSVRLTKVKLLDKMIEDVNSYYNGRWTVKAGKMMKLYVFSSWQFLTLLATVLLLLLTSLQAFCSVYSCGNLFHVQNNN